MANEAKKTGKSRFGEILLEYGIITQEQLKKALRRQLQVGGHIGSILEEMGFLDEDSLLSFLSKQLNLSPVNLFEMKISANILRLIPYDKVKHLRVLPISESGSKVTLAMVQPNDLGAIQDVEFAIGRRIEPVITPCHQMDKAIAYFDKTGYGKKDFIGEILKTETVSVQPRAVEMRSLVRDVLESNATDLHITAGVPPSIRVDSELKRLSMPSMTPQQIEDIAFNVLTQKQREVFERDNEIDLAVTFPDTGRFRVNIYKQRNSISISARFIIEEMPTLKKLLLPGWLNDYAMKTQGLILITGPSGHGKTTTMTALIDIINSQRKCNIITIEDPIEYLHKHKKSNINQREIGVDTESFAVGLKHVFRQNPDVIVIGEMRDPESIAIALTAAETGHLVLSTMHSLNSTSAINRIIDIFPGNQQHQVRMQFADSFLFVLSQRLVQKKGGKGLIVACESLLNTNRTRMLIRDNKTHTIRSLMQVGSDDFSSIDTSLARLCIEGKITEEAGLKYSDNSKFYLEMVKAKQLS